MKLIAKSMATGSVPSGAFEGSSLGNKRNFDVVGDSIAGGNLPARQETLRDTNRTLVYFWRRWRYR